MNEVTGRGMHVNAPLAFASSDPTWLLLTAVQIDNIHFSASIRRERAMRAFVTLDTDCGRCHVNLRAVQFLVPRDDGGLDLVFPGNTRLTTTSECGKALLGYIRAHDPAAETMEFEFTHVPDEVLEAASRLLELEAN